MFGTQDRSHNKIDSDGAEIIIDPRYSVDTENTGIIVSYTKDGVEGELTDF